MKDYMQAGEFRKKCFEILDRVKKTRKKVVIINRNKPVAQLVPIEEKEASLFGAMKGTVRIKGDLIAPVSELGKADR